jgi:hypothetical protein
MEPRSKDEPNSIFASFNRLLFSRTRNTKVLPIQQENNSLSYVVHTASSFTRTEIVSLAGVEKRVKGNKNNEDGKTIPITIKQARRQSGEVYK